MWFECYIPATTTRKVVAFVVPHDNKTHSIFPSVVTAIRQVLVRRDMLWPTLPRVFFRSARIVDLLWATGSAPEALGDLRSLYKKQALQWERRPFSHPPLLTMRAQIFL
jgi:hypothetical protein